MELLIFKSFYFEIIFCLQKSYKDSIEFFHVPFTWFPKHITTVYLSKLRNQLQNLFRFHQFFH